MDPSSKHKLLLKSKLKKKMKLKLVKSLDETKDSMHHVAKKETKAKLKSRAKPKLIIDDEPTALAGKSTMAKPKPGAGAGADAGAGTGIVIDSGSGPITISKYSVSSKVEPKKRVLATDDIKKDLDTKLLIDGIERLNFTEKSNTYKYEPDLNTNLSDLSVIKPNEKFYICAYRINNTGLKPFIQYCFHKDSKDILSFPVLKHSGKKSVDKQGSDFINYIFKENPECSFFTRIREGHNYLFYNVSVKEKEYGHFIRKKSQWWWALMTEIVNYKKIINFDIHPNVYAIFINNPSLIYLKDKDDEIIEIPEVGFHGTYYGLLNMISTYGLRPSTINSMMGPYYYFGTFRKAVRYAGWTSTYKSREIDGVVVADKEGRYERGGIARFAIFLGKMKVFLNQPNERNDYSELVEQRIKRNPRDKRWEDLTIKLHDHNGKWAEEYDSCYIGRVKLSNGGLFMKNPEFILKNFEQQHILTIHELDKKTLKRNWDGNYNKYNIL